MVGQNYKVCGVGAGILGVPVCAVIASQCPELSVSVVDGDSELVNHWNNGPDCPIQEVSENHFVFLHSKSQLTQRLFLFEIARSCGLTEAM